MAEKLQGFTLELEGPEEHLQRILRAAYKEMHRLALETAANPVYRLGVPYNLPPRLTVRGKIHYRSDIA